MKICGDKVIGKFIERPNRFLVKVEIDNKVEVANLRDSGRLKELLIPGREILLLRKEPIKKRKTKFDVIAVKINGDWIIINSSIHTNLVVEQIRKKTIPELSHCNVIRREVKVGNSRLDLELNCNGKLSYMEIKGCTLSISGVALFPDAPTERGKRHLEELINLTKKGFETYLFFVVTRPDAEILAPNWITDLEFATKLEDALKAGVKVIAYIFTLNGYEIKKNGRIPVVSYRELDPQTRAYIEEELKKF